MDVSEKKLKKRLIAKRKEIKNKLDMLKHGEIVRTEMFSPITKHLKIIEKQLEPTRKISGGPAKVEPSSPPPEEMEQELVEPTSPENLFSSTALYDDTPRKKGASSKRKNLLNFSIGEESSIGGEPSGLKRSIIKEIKEEEHNPDTKRENDIMEASFQDYLKQYDPLPRKYIRNMRLDEDNEFDHKYGVRHNPTLEKFYIGDSQLFIKGSDVVVQNKTYKGTRGLYELLFKKYPKEFTTDDEKAYKDIVLKTNAHRRYYQASKQVDGSRLLKYKKIIAPIASTTGEGMLMEVTNNKIDYVHWDDPNELVERLRLLIASQQAGNTSHINEINSIVEELREAHIIA